VAIIKRHYNYQFKYGVRDPRGRPRNTSIYVAYYGAYRGKKKNYGEMIDGDSGNKMRRLEGPLDVLIMRLQELNFTSWMDLKMFRKLEDGSEVPFELPLERLVRMMFYKKKRKQYVKIRERKPDCSDKDTPR